MDAPDDRKNAWWCRWCRRAMLALFPWLREHRRVKEETRRVAAESDRDAQHLRGRMIRVLTSIRTRTPMDRID